MKKYAAHYIHLCFGTTYKGLYHIILNDSDIFMFCEKLEQEIESVSFYNGILFLIPQYREMSPELLLKEFQELQKKNPSMSAFQIMDLSGYFPKKTTINNFPVDVFYISDLDLSSPKFCTDNGCCYGYIERL